MCISDRVSLFSDPCEWETVRLLRVLASSLSDVVLCEECWVRQSCVIGKGSCLLIACSDIFLQPHVRDFFHFEKDFIFSSVCVSVVCGYVIVGAGVGRGQERVLDLPDLELQVHVIHLTWVLGIELGSPERPTSALHC